MVTFLRIDQIVVLKRNYPYVPYLVVVTKPAAFLASTAHEAIEFTKFLESFDDSQLLKINFVYYYIWVEFGNYIMAR
jgi:hypothetical protein